QFKVTFSIRSLIRNFKYLVVERGSFAFKYHENLLPSESSRDSPRIPAGKETVLQQTWFRQRM
ncbi:MAG: hypothetical protein U0936_18365, partial [Planctomycetaceae bacterium]